MSGISKNIKAVLHPDLLGASANVLGELHTRARYNHTMKKYCSNALKSGVTPLSLIDTTIPPEGTREEGEIPK